MNKYDTKFKEMLKTILIEQKENKNNILEDADIKEEFKNTIRNYFFSKVENTPDFKKIFPNYDNDKKSTLPKDIMGPKGDGRKVTTMEKEIRKNENNVQDFVGSQKPVDFSGPVVPFGEFIKSVNLNSKPQQKKIQEMKPTSDSDIENYGV